RSSWPTCSRSPPPSIGASNVGGGGNSSPPEPHPVGSAVGPRMADRSLLLAPVASGPTGGEHTPPPAGCAGRSRPCQVGLVGAFGGRGLLGGQEASPVGVGAAGSSRRSRRPDRTGQLPRRRHASQRIGRQLLLLVPGVRSGLGRWGGR